MADQVIRELESAAHIFLAPPNVVTPQQRQSAEAVFMNFRKTKSPYELCRAILETSTVDYVLFEAVGLLKSALVKEWTMLPKEHIDSLRQYLFRYIINRTTLALFVRERILQVIAIIIKWGSSQDGGEERKLILNEVEHLIRSGDRPRKLIGCSIINALMQEYAITVKSSDIGLTWEAHIKVKQQFQIVDLKRILKFSIGALVELTEEGIAEENFSLIKHLLSITEDVLAWSFVYNPHSKILVGCFEDLCETTITPSLRLNTTWGDVILDSAIIQVFFTLYWKVRTMPQLAHHARNCLVQLASLNGSIFQANNFADKGRYLTNYMREFLKLVCNADIIDYEAVGIANIIRKIIVFFRSPARNSLPEDLFQSFMEQMTRLTCLFIEGAAQEESMCANDCLYIEALEHVLGAWTPFLFKSDIFSWEFCKQSFVQIFNVYLKCHLSPPDGTRDVCGNEVDEEIDFLEEDDGTRFKYQLLTIGTLGRDILGHSLPVLSRLLENRTVRLREQLNCFAGQPEAMSIATSTVVKRLYDDLHWLVLLAGHVLCTESDGELAFIPADVIVYSIDQARQGRMDMNVTLQLLASLQSNVSDINGAEESADHVVRLSTAVLRLCEFEKNAIAANLTSILSPELSSTIVWFLRRWSLQYLLPVENNYAEISTTLLEAFGEDSQAGQWTMNYILEKVVCNVDAFKSEPTIIKDTIQLLIALVECPVKASSVLKSECLGRLIELATKSRYDLPQAAKRGLMRAMVLAGSGFGGGHYALQYWPQTLKPLLDRFQHITSNENFPRSYHQENVRIELIDVLESFIGVAQGVRNDTVVVVFQHTIPVLGKLADLLSFYHNYQELVQLILEVFCEYTRGMLCFLDQAHSVRIYEACLHSIQTYARFNSNRLTAEATAEDDNFQDILLLMQLLTNLLSKDIYDMSDAESGIVDEQSPTPADVFLYGLNIVMPLMTTDMLKFPTLCRQYFKMIVLICETHPKKVCGLPPELLQKLMGSVELGLFSCERDIILLCCDIIQEMGRHIYDEAKHGGPTNQLMAPFLSLLMNLILAHQINSDVMSHMSTPFYNLICCYQEQYRQIVQNVLTTQADPQIAQRLASAFTELTTNMKLNTEQLHKLKFRSNFEKFILNIQGFMMIK